MKSFLGLSLTAFLSLSFFTNPALSLCAMDPSPLSNLNSSSILSPSPIVKIPARIHHVTHNPATSVYLFRGGSPDYNPVSQPDQVIMDFAGLHQGIIISAADPTEHPPLPLNASTPFYIIDINLLNFKDDSDIQNTIAEFSYFASDPISGEFVLFENAGTKDDANNPIFFKSDTVSQSVLTEFRSYVYGNEANMRNNDQLERQMELIQSMLDDTKLVDKINAKRRMKRQAAIDAGKLVTSDNGDGNRELLDITAVVMYFHCDCGCDRTGEVAGAYYLKHLKMSWEDTIKLNTAVIQARSMTCMNYRSLQWYCLYLNSIGYNNNCLANPVPCTPDEC